METLELKAEVREVAKSPRQVRQAGLVPAVLYGREIESTPLQVEAKALQKVLKEAGSHQLISLQISKRKPVMTLVRDVQRNSLKHNYVHVDFYAVKMDEKVKASVPLVIEGVSPAIKDRGGILTHGLDEVEIECLPADLISAISVNIDSLVDFHSVITVADLKVPASITILSDPDSMVARVEAPRTAEEVEAMTVVAETAAEPEVLTAKKKEEEEE
jgi:large subunit ribosomal protein L25